MNFPSAMATITSAGEILSVASAPGEQQDDTIQKDLYASKNQYIKNKNRTVIVPRVLKTIEKTSRKNPKKFDIDGIAFESDDSEYDCSDDSENDDDGSYVKSPISPPSAPRVVSDEGMEVSISSSFGSIKNIESAQSEATSVGIYDTAISRSFDSNKDSNKGEESTINKVRPAILPDPLPVPSLRSTPKQGRLMPLNETPKQGRLMPLNETSPQNFADPAIIKDNSECSVQSEESIQDEILSQRDITSKSNSVSNRGRVSIMSQPEELEERNSVRSRQSDGSELSETTPIKFYESNITDFDFDSSDSSENSNATPVKLGDSRRNLAAAKKFMGMSTAQRKASQRFEAELLDEAIEEDAERDIVNVYLEASAFADRERINLTEDIYSFVLACSYLSVSFWTAIYFILVKFLCYGVIFVNLTRKTYTGEGQDPAVLATKFIMIPVAVAMQEDLVTLYYNVANKKYDALTYKGNRYATETKWVLSNLLRAIDGVMSLAVNFGVMLLETDLLNIFLGFAALDFLQYIDDVIYELAEKGFFGEKLEQATIACKIITFTRRTQSGDPCNNFITNLDTILLLGSMATCCAIYICALTVFYTDEDNTLFGLGLDRVENIP